MTTTGGRTPGCAVGFDHGAEAQMADPYGVYAEVRDRCPISWVDRYDGFWLYSRHEDVMAGSLDPELYSSADGVTIPPIGSPRALPLEADPPEHRRYRGVLQPSLSTRTVARLEEPIRNIARDLLAAFAASGSADLAVELAQPLPPLVIANLFGLPIDDCQYFRELTQTMVGGGSPQEAGRAGADLLAYLSGHIEARASHPEDDLASLLAASVVAGEISGDEALAMAQLIVVAGHETTVSALAAMVLHVGSEPGLQQRLQADRSLIPAACEESLRLQPPVQAFGRTLTRDAERAGVALRSGDRVMLLYGAANRDGARFEHPDDFVLGRTPNPHLSFGAGVHRCIGAPLGLLEMRVVLEEILDTLPGLSVNPDEARATGMYSRTFVSVPARWTV